jgi:hypothetical protein
MTEFVAWEDLSEKEQLETIYSDAFKDVHGFRPRGFDMTVNELKIALDELQSEIEFQIKESEAAEKVAIDRFHSIVAETMEICNCDKPTAVKYLIDAENVYGDWEHFCFNYGLPFSFPQIQGA